MNAGATSHAEQLLQSAETLLAARMLAAALQQFTAAQRAGADADRCSAGLWMTYMLVGNFEGAWQQSDAIRTPSVPDVHRFWRGEEIRDRRVILRCLHGFGDAVQFLRYAPLLQEAASSLVIEVPPKLLNLARCFDGVDEVITWGDQASLNPPMWDVQIEIMELPYLFRTTMADLPMSTRYVQPPPAEKSVGATKALRTGVVWTAGSWNISRSLPLHLLEPLLHVENCMFWNLQVEVEETSHRDDLLNRMHVDERSRTSIEGLAAIIAQLDLVLTVDTLAAHLAGALGIPAFLMLAHEADWRWMHERRDSPWYPSLQLFRQPSPGAWAPVMEAVLPSLVERAQAHHGERLERDRAPG